jgi:hypothetical protein
MQRNILTIFFHLSPVLIGQITRAGDGILFLPPRYSKLQNQWNAKYIVRAYISDMQALNWGRERKFCA